MKFFKSSKSAKNTDGPDGPVEWHPGGARTSVSCPTPLYAEPYGDPAHHMQAPTYGQAPHEGMTPYPPEMPAQAFHGEGPYGRPADGSQGANIVGFARSSLRSHTPQAEGPEPASRKGRRKTSRRSEKQERPRSNLRPFLFGTLFGMALMFAFLALPLGGTEIGEGATFDAVDADRDTSPPAENTFLDQAMDGEAPRPE